MDLCIECLVVSWVARIGCLHLAKFHTNEKMCDYLKSRAGKNT